ncbi:MAG: PHP domain-containing protein [Solirubrobacterales bacterium]
MLHDHAAAIHVHSTFSDGSGTPREIVDAGHHAGLDIVILTDHDSLGARTSGDEGWHGDLLLLAGMEVTPGHGDHYLAFGLEKPVAHAGLYSRGVTRAVAEQGGFGFAAHPFAHGNPHVPGGKAQGWSELDFDRVRGIEVWNFLADTACAVRSYRDGFRIFSDPAAALAGPPAANLAGWDRLGRKRRVAGIAGLDEHQFQLQVAGRVLFRTLSYAESFRHLRTHVLTPGPLAGDLAADRALILDALGEGRCFMAVDSLADSRGTAFWAEQRDQRLEMGQQAGVGPGWTVRAELPAAAELRLLVDGHQVAGRDWARELTHVVAEPGVVRLEACREQGGEPRTWVLTNPLYLRGPGPAG